MEDVKERLRQLVEEACRYQPGSIERQRKLTALIRLVSGKLWKERTPYYQDALQQTWVYFCQNICESTTGERYDPDRGSVVTWLNSYLKRRLQDGYIAMQKQRATQTTSFIRWSRSGEPQESVDLIETIAGEPDVPPILETVKAWVESDPKRELSHLHIAGHPEVTCQLLILRRLPPETSWKDLSEEFGLSISTLSSFYQRQCLPRLRKFGQSEGYL